MADSFLDLVYRHGDPAEIRALYDAWAASYDAEIAANGYVTPERMANALFDHLPDTETPVLDFGCGTGLSGLALKLKGLTVIDGMDPSPEMLDMARRKGVYRNLTLIGIDDPAPVPADRYPVITAVGAIGTGAAPPATIDTLLRALPPGGLLGFSLNDHALADPVYKAALTSWLEAGKARVAFEEYGPHLPRRNLNSTVYIIEKT